jgi:hypothetical protein
MKKQLQTTALINELGQGSVFFKPPSPTNHDLNLHNTPISTPQVTLARDISSENSREKPRETLLPLPTRDAIQEFSFRLRDDFKVKLQAEIPHHWQEELETLARQLKVKKLELYRYIIGDFLGKTDQRGNPA